MKSKIIVASGVGAASLMLLAGAAFAQAKPPAPSAAMAPPVNHGPPLAGVCIFSDNRAIGSSKVGQYVGGRMNQIITAVNSELKAERTAIETEARSLDTASKAPGADQNTLQQRALVLQQRDNVLQKKAQLRDREVQVTQQKAVTRIAQEMEPIVVQVYQQKQCSILLSGEAVQLGNPAMDITAAVVAGTDAKIQQFTFDRERLDQPAAAPAAATPPKK